MKPNVEYQALSREGEEEVNLCYPWLPWQPRRLPLWDGLLPGAISSTMSCPAMGSLVCTEVPQSNHFKSFVWGCCYALSGFSKVGEI